MFYMTHSNSSFCLKSMKSVCFVRSLKFFTNNKGEEIEESREKTNDSKVFDVRAARRKKTTRRIRKRTAMIHKIGKDVPAKQQTRIML